MLPDDTRERPKHLFTGVLLSGDALLFYNDGTWTQRSEDGTTMDSGQWAVDGPALLVTDNYTHGPKLHKAVEELQEAYDEWREETLRLTAKLIVE